MVTGPRIVPVCMGLGVAGKDVEWKEQQLTLRRGTDEPELERGRRPSLSLWGSGAM